MKRMKLVALALCTGLVLTACGGANNNTEENVTVTEESQNDVSENSDDKSDNVETDKSEDSDENKTDENKADTEDADNQNNEDDNTEAAETDSVSVRAIYDEIAANVELVSPMEPPADFIGNIIYGFNVAELPEYVFSMPEVAESAELVFIAKTTGADQADTVKNSLDAYKTEQAEMMKDYIPAEYDIIEAGQVVIKGDYVYLVISHNRDAIVEIIEKNIQ